MPPADTTTELSFRIFAGVLAIASAPLAAANLLTMLFAASFDLGALSDPTMLLRAGSNAADLWRWSMILDLLGYYLLIVPLIVALRRSLAPTSSGWMDLSALSLLFYCAVGAAGAVILATGTPPLIASYGAADAARRAELEIVSRAFSDAIYRGLWNSLEELLAAIGWLGFGLRQRSGQRLVGWTAIVLGGACLADWLGSILQLEPLATVGLVIYLVLAPLWALGSGIGLLRRT